jgi:hypothetical protein
VKRLSDLVAGPNKCHTDGRSRGALKNFQEHITYGPHMKVNCDYLYPSTRSVQKISFRPGLRHAL